MRWAMDDIVVRRHVLDELDYAPMVDAASIGVAVDDGVVTLTGHVRTYAVKGIAERTAWSAPGVRAVEDRLTLA